MIVESRHGFSTHRPMLQCGMATERHLKLFRNGRNQAVRIPREFELPGDAAVMRKEGERLIIEAEPKKKTLLEVLATFDVLDEKFREIEDFPPDDVILE